MASTRESRVRKGKKVIVIPVSLHRLAMWSYRNTKLNFSLMLVFRRRISCYIVIINTTFIQSISCQEALETQVLLFSLQLCKEFVHSLKTKTWNLKIFEKANCQFSLGIFLKWVTFLGIWMIFKNWLEYMLNQ
jgi:hypothetical protein